MKAERNWMNYIQRLNENTESSLKYQTKYSKQNSSVDP